MKRLKKSKRVSWPSDAKLCQVKLFLSEDCPSKVGLLAQDRLESKAWVSCLKTVYSINHHSRFEGRCSMDPLKGTLTYIAQIKWQCPPKFLLSHNWHVVAGEESEEAEIQKHREKRVLEAVYPDLSYIPHSPSRSLDLHEYHLDDSHIPLIPITPIEEGAVDLPSAMATPQHASFEPQSQALPQGVLSVNPNAPQCDPQPCVDTSAKEKTAPEVLLGFQADVGVAVVAAVTAIMKSEEKESLIDTNLLIKFLTDPKMIEKLISEQVALANTQNEPVYGSIPSLVEEVINKDVIFTNIGSTSISGSNLVTPSVSISALNPDPVIKRLGNEPGEAANTGAPPVTPSMSLPRRKPDPVIEQLVQKYRALTDTEAAPLSVSKPLSNPKSDPVIENLIGKHTAPAKTAGAAPPSGSNPTTFGFAFPSPRSVPVVKKSIHECGVPTDAGSAPFYLGKLPPQLTSFFPSLKQEDVKIKRRIDGYGILDCTGNEPVSRSMPSSNANVIWGKSVHSHPLPSMGETGLQFKGLSPDHARPNSSALPNLVQPSSKMKALSPDSALVSSFSAIAAARPIKDMNYIKSLVRQHGDIHAVQDFSLSQSGKSDVHAHDAERVSNLIPKVHTVDKHCIYYNSPKGCRNGSNCLYRHDMPRKFQPGSVLEGPSAKRMKLGREIIGRS